MSVSLDSGVRRTMPPTAAETAAVERVVATHSPAFPNQDEGSPYLCESHDGEPAEVLAGSTKTPSAPGRLLPVLDHEPGSVGESRRALSGAEWRVDVDDLDVPRDGTHGTHGYALPGVRDADPAAEAGGM
ncbi:hypothetical protein ACIRJR_16870 [Streptomyces sp. NPDC102402]|uniref:hypothetical protein n=1 Tax=Streptomyces sp. NPDC102402 TaxID=3366169 RepID=UPI00381DF9AF